MKSLIISLLLIALSVFADEQQYKSTFDYIEQTGRLWGISEIRLNTNDTVTLVDAQSGYGRGLWIISEGKALPSQTIKVGESCTLIDGHHVTLTYKLKAFEGQKIIIIVTNNFDARSFGEEVKTDTKVIPIRAYKENNSNQGMDPTESGN